MLAEAAIQLLIGMYPSATAPAAGESRQVFPSLSGGKVGPAR
jgi:hypothetical protein